MGQPANAVKLLVISRQDVKILLLGHVYSCPRDSLELECRVIVSQLHIDPCMRLVVIDSLNKCLRCILAAWLAPCEELIQLLLLSIRLALGTEEAHMLAPPKIIGVEVGVSLSCLALIPGRI